MNIPLRARGNSHKVPASFTPQIPLCMTRNFNLRSSLHTLCTLFFTSLTLVSGSIGVGKSLSSLCSCVAVSSTFNIMEPQTLYQSKLHSGKPLITVFSPKNYWKYNNVFSTTTTTTTTVGSDNKTALQKLSYKERAFPCKSQVSGTILPEIGYYRKD
jgi:hypothetical protein